MLTPTTDVRAPLKSIEETQVISRAKFLDSIFASTQFLTDHFLEKDSVQAETLNICQHLRKELNTHTNLLIDYSVLYGHIEAMKHRSTIGNLERYLHAEILYLRGFYYLPVSTI